MPIFATLRIARPAVAAFAAMGMLWGSFAATLPDLKLMLNVDEAQLGLLMFLTPIAAMGGMFLAPTVGANFGKWALPFAGLLMCASFALPGQTHSLALFPLAMMLAGIGTGMTDVLMNARVSAMENLRGLHLMNLSHAFYSFGYAASAIACGFMRASGWPPGWVMGTIAMAAGILASASYAADGAIDGLNRPKDRASAALGLVPLIGGGMVFIAFLTENAAENWSALHIEQTLGGSPEHGALGPATMALTMGIARLFGQGLSHKISPLILLTSGAAVASIGALTVAGATIPATAYAGFVVMGIGASVIAPTAFSLVGQYAEPHARARAVARATLLGYFGYFFGPPMFGFIAGHLGLPMAFAFAAVALLAIPALAYQMKRAPLIGRPNDRKGR